MWFIRGVVLIALGLAWFALSPMARAVNPPPDGFYPGGNTAEGQNALFVLTTGSYNTALGFQALFHDTTGSYNTATGFRTLFENTTGNFNTATGFDALYHNTTGSQNTATGFHALFSLTTGSFNTADGSRALYLNTTGSLNTASGDHALSNNTTGSENTADGSLSLLSNTTGNFNTAIGRRALISNTTGSSNVAVGHEALFKNTTGNLNTAVGDGALTNNTTGAGNIGLGEDAGVNLTTGSNNIDIGNDGVAAESGVIRIGTVGTHSKTLLTGPVGIGTDNPTQAFLVVDGALGNSQNAGRYFDGSTNALTDLNNAGHAAYSIFASARILTNLSFDAASDARIKRIEGRSDAVGDLNTLMKIEVTNYKLKDTIAQGNLSQKKAIGQQLEQVYPQAVNLYTNVVPDIYKQAGVKDGWVQLASDLKVGERVRLIGEKGEEGINEVLEVREGAFRTAFHSATEKVFVYGREVKDFRTVDYSAITMLNVSATQEIKKEKDAEIAGLKAENKQLQKEMRTILARLKEQEAKIQKVSAQVELSKATPKTVSLDN